MDIKVSNNKSNAIESPFGWYILLAANSLLMLGIAIGWILSEKTSKISNQFAPIVSCLIISTLIASAFYWFQGKDLYLIKRHTKQKYVNNFFISIFLHVLNVLVAASFLICFNVYFTSNKYGDYNMMFIIEFSIVALISIVSLSFYRIAQYKIARDLSIRKHGFNEKIKEAIKEERTKAPVESKKETKREASASFFSQEDESKK